MANKPDLQVLATLAGPRIGRLSKAELTATNVAKILSILEMGLERFQAAPVVSTKARAQSPDRIQEEVNNDLLTCRECGREMKMLKRHIWTEHRLTPDNYRDKYRLTADSSMTAPGYAAVRSHLAKESGLGKSNTKGVGRN